MAAMAKSATNDSQTKRLGKSYLYDKLPPTPLTKYVLVNADHLGTPTAAAAEMITWLRLLEKQ